MSSFGAIVQRVNVNYTQKRNAGLPLYYIGLHSGLPNRISINHILNIKIYGKNKDTFFGLIFLPKTTLVLISCWFVRANYFVDGGHVLN